jgi:hypothetical protein
MSLHDGPPGGALQMPSRLGDQLLSYWQPLLKKKNRDPILFFFLRAVDKRNNSVPHRHARRSTINEGVNAVAKNL